MTFQTYDPPGANPQDIRDRVERLRATFSALDIEGVLVPHEDAYQSEYLPPSEERLAFITGFTGSAGRAVILEEKALFVTDGRYTLQAASQVPEDVFDVVSKDEDADQWLKSHLGDARIGYDPNLHARSRLEALAKTVPDVTLVALESHPVDGTWTDRPAPTVGMVRAHGTERSGRTVAEKLADVRASFDADGLFIGAADTVSWLFNWRGSDIAHTPLVLCRAFIPKEGPVTVFVDPHKLPNEFQEALEGLADIEPTSAYPAALTRLSQNRTILADPAAASEAALKAIEEGGSLKTGKDPAARLKSIKNEAEIEGMRAAHQRDGLAMVRLLAWLDANAVGQTEIAVCERLENLRREMGAMDVSFDTIAGAGPNGAIVHYRVDRNSNRTIASGDPVLIDSGGQYEDGTTDITRTIVAGDPSDEFKVQFTRVLKGHIAIARQHFPAGTTGAALDSFARSALWSAGFDYQHGTGHGVGAALAVHEGPPGISKRSSAALEPGMIVSNEPGYYRQGAYGIRIENLVLVRPPEVPPGGDTPMLSFETITLAPIDTRLVVPSMMSPGELAWLDLYHARVLGALGAELEPQTRDWLEATCRPIGG
ncbi:MAG: aminopeptidase P family protein [Pseudomonadota bacterium]